MSVAFLAPFGLAALAALALPVLIHLIRRIELRTTPFAALRWISVRARPRRRIRIERPWLLLLRLALLALLALLLARPVVTEMAATSQPWVVVAPGVDRAVAHAAVSGGEWHWLAPGFPTLENAPSSTTIPVSSLLRQLDADLPAATALTVVVPEQLAGLDGERLQVARAVDWRIVPGRMTEGDAVAADATTRIAVRYTPDSQPAVAYLRAAVAAWNIREPGRYQLDAQPVAKPIADTQHWLVWLASTLSAQASDWIARGGVALVANHPAPDAAALWRDVGGGVLARKQTVGRGRLLALPGALDPAALPMLLDADFPDRLRVALQGPPAAPTRANADTVRPLQDTFHGTSRAHSADPARPLDPWLALLIAWLLLLERVVATRSRAKAAS